MNPQQPAPATPAISDTGAFRRAIEQGDLATLLNALAPDVIFSSPIVYHDYSGRDAVAPILAAVAEVFAGFHYTDEYDAPNGKVLRFRARVGARDLEGVDILTFDAAGLITHFTVMVRPYSGANALREAMAAKLAALGE